ncbi:MAG: sensor domain-containing diguanylate cyclase, partial [Microbacteriaceae bacterium]|nr:sensor domain-containing diguanylate cyclase [Burkholderiaceae bacterium]
MSHDIVQGTGHGTGQGLSETDLRALATLLEDFGVSLGLAGNDRRVQPLAAGMAASSSAPRLASIVLADGRRLVVSGREHRVVAGAPTTPPTPTTLPTPPTPATAPAQPAVPSPFIAERRAGADTADMRFRLLAEHSIDLIVAVDADLAIRYASPATASLLGCAPNDLHGHTLAELLAPEDRAAFIARHFTKAAQRGVVPDLFRALRRDGSTLWVEARVASLPPGNGLGDYLVTLRDADQRRHAEETLGRMNAELSTLASTDALTGLPNRRQFDATLHKEWYRALRDATPLGLLMIDVDRFKPLNDRFGHQIGDRFLAGVGQAIRDNVRRASDMAARYGGEEFAVVLPGTGAAGALEIAEVIRRAGGGGAT